MIKKFISLFAALMLVTVSIFAFACGDDGGKQQIYSVYAPDGAPALAIAKFILDDESFESGKSFEYNVVTNSEITAAISVNNASFVILPVNNATKLYNENGGYKMAAVITHGNLYLASSFSIETTEDLKNKCILMPNAENTVPDLTLKSILKDNNLEYIASDNPVENKVAIKYFANGSAVIAQLSASGSNDYVALLPEPAVTKLATIKTAYSYRFDLQKAFDNEQNSYPQAVLMVSSNIAKNDRSIIDSMSNSFAINMQWVKNNSQLAVDTIKQKFEATTLSSLSTASIEACNIYWGGAAFEKNAVINYINKIRNINSDCASVVSDDFFL